jgi:hypothetical protein
MTRDNMRRQRTTPILVIAILHLVGGGLGLIGSLCGCGGLLMGSALSSVAQPTFPTRPGQARPPQPPPDTREVMKYLQDHVPGYLAFTIVTLALSFLLDMMLISGGIGLLNMQPWARWLSLIYAPISIVYRIVSTVYQLVWVMPATKALYAGSMGGSGFSSIVDISSGIGVFFSLLVILYPIAVLIILLLPSTAAAFRGELPIRKDELDDDEDDRWRDPSPRSDKFRQ